MKYSKIFLRWWIGLTLALLTVLFSLILNLSQEAAASASWKMPWPVAFQGVISQSLHVDGARPGAVALDIGLPAGTPVLAPIRSRVVRHCVAQGTQNHRTIVLRASSNVLYSLAHVTTAQVKSSYRQGEQIGVIAPETRVNDPSCATSTGVHLHFGLPQNPATIDGQRLGGSTVQGDRLSSSNQPR